MKQKLTTDWTKRMDVHDPKFELNEWFVILWWAITNNIKKLNLLLQYLDDGMHAPYALKRVRRENK